MSAIDEVIANAVEEIWIEFDKDNSGALDKTETKNFMVKTLAEMTESQTIPDEDFDACFAEFDKNGDGTISRAEMASFIKKVAGFE